MKRIGLVSALVGLLVPLGIAAPGCDDGPLNPCRAYLNHVEQKAASCGLAPAEVSACEDGCRSVEGCVGPCPPVCAGARLDLAICLDTCVELLNCACISDLAGYSTEGCTAEIDKPWSDCYLACVDTVFGSAP